MRDRIPITINIEMRLDDATLIPTAILSSDARIGLKFTTERLKA